MGRVGIARRSLSPANFTVTRLNSSMVFISSFSVHLIAEVLKQACGLSYTVLKVTIKYIGVLSGAITTSLKQIFPVFENSQQLQVRCPARVQRPPCAHRTKW